MSVSRDGSFTVMTYNVGNGLVAPESLTKFLRESGAELIGLQEVDAGQAAALEADRDSFPFQVVRGSGFEGRGLLSQHPILEHEWLDISPGRPDLRVSIDLFSTKVTVLVAHPRPPKFRRGKFEFDEITEAQIDRVGALTSGAAPAILIGDFNMTPRNPAHARLIAAGLIDAQLAAGSRRAATFPVRPGKIRRGNHRLSWVPLLPVARFDYVWHTRDITPLGAWIGRHGGSDHRPVLARLALAEAIAN